MEAQSPSHSHSTDVMFGGVDGGAIVRSNPSLAGSRKEQEIETPLSETNGGVRNADLTTGFGRNMFLSSGLGSSAETIEAYLHASLHRGATSRMSALRPHSYRWSGSERRTSLCSSYRLKPRSCLLFAFLKTTERSLGSANLKPTFAAVNMLHSLSREALPTAARVVIVAIAPFNYY